MKRHIDRLELLRLYISLLHLLANHRVGKVEIKGLILGKEIYVHMWLSRNLKAIHRV